MEHGHSGASTLEIATRAKVSKRELYALVGSKQDMLVARIAERSARMRLAPADRPTVRDRDSLTRVLQALGARLLGEVSGKDNGAPGLRPHYHANYYAAFVIDLDGHNIEVVCHEPVA